MRNPEHGEAIGVRWGPGAEHHLLPGRHRDGVAEVRDPVDCLSRWTPPHLAQDRADLVGELYLPIVRAEAEPGPERIGREAGYLNTRDKERGNKGARPSAVQGRSVHTGSPFPRR